MKILIAFPFFLLLAVFHVNAQYTVSNTPQNSFDTIQNPIDSIYSFENNDSVSGPWDHLTINSDSRINKLLEIKKEESIRKRGMDGKVGMDGFRVQIYRGTSRKEANRIESQFLSKFPGYAVDLRFPGPDFWVRVGNFRTRSEAIYLQNKIDRNFPNSLIVEDVINFPELKTESDTKGEL